MLSFVNFLQNYTTRTKGFLQILDFCFKGGNKQYLVVGKHDARFANNEKKGSITYSQSSPRNTVK